MPFGTSARRTLVMAALSLFGACGGGGDGGTTNPPPAGGFSFALSANTLSVAAGGSGSVTATVSRTGSFTGAVELSIEGAPTGITATFSPATVASGATSATLNIAVGGSVTPGGYQFTVRGKAAGLTDQTTTVALTVTAPPAIALALTPNAASVAQGGSTSVAVAISRTNFTGEVALAVSGVPAGATGTISTTPTTGNSAQLQLAVGANVVPGAYPVTVTGSGAGVTNVAATFALTVTAAAPPSIVLSVSPTSASVSAGGSTQFTVSIVRTNFSGAVALAVNDLPSGATTAITTSPTTGNSAVVTVSTSPTSPSGQFQLSVVASAAGGLMATAIFNLTVTAPVSGGNVTWDYAGCSAGDIPLWFAVRSGNGGWTRVPATNGNTFVFSMAATGGVAIVTPSGGNGYAIDFVFGTLAELQREAVLVPCTFAGTKTFTGTVAGLTSASSLARVTLGRTSAAVQLANPTFRLTNVDVGSLDLVATRQLINLANPSALPTTDKLIIRRGLNLGTGAAIPTLDFASGEAFNPEVRTATVNGVAAGEVGTVTSAFFTLNPTYTNLSATALLGSQLLAGPSAIFAAVPSARLLSSDLHVVEASATPSGCGATCASRFVSTVFKDPANVSLALPATLNAPTISTLGSAPYLRTRVQLARQSDYDRAWTVAYAQPGRTVSVRVTAGYLGGAPLDFQFPDFSGLAGWQGIWAPSAGVLTSWTLSASGWSAAGDGTAAAIVSGTTIRMGARTGQFTP